jgi:uncharacterized protein YdhG (YjbR/CyaY superfamily)
MKLKTFQPSTVTGYISAAPPAARSRLRQMRACVRKAAPGAKEGLKWGLPAIFDRRILVMYGGFQHHLGFYPTPSAIKAFARKLAGYAMAKGSVQFPLEKPLPLALIRQIVRFRVKESSEQDCKWRS